MSDESLLQLQVSNVTPRTELRRRVGAHSEWSNKCEIREFEDRKQESTFSQSTALLIHGR
jgi:hypothetical protein